MNKRLRQPPFQNINLLINTTMEKNIPKLPANNEAVVANALLSDAAGLFDIGQVARGLVNVDNYCKGKAQNHLEVSWDKDSGVIFVFKFRSNNESAVKAMALATKTPVTKQSNTMWLTCDV
jgi:hypothetical protein